MSKLILILGICQIVAGVVLVGLVAKYFHNVNTIKPPKPDTDKANAFGPVLIGLLVVVSGIIGALSSRSASGATDVLYLISATVAASASAAMVWIYSINYHDRCAGNAIKKAISCPDDVRDLTITILAFSIACCAMSCLGMVSSGLTTCRKV